MSMTTLALLPAALFSLTSCSSTSNPPPVGSAIVTLGRGSHPSTVVQTVETTATVSAIDVTQRKATLEGRDGEKFTVKVGRQANNFDQISVGDRVAVTMVEKLVDSFADKETPSSQGAVAVAAQAPNGSQPDPLVAETTQRTAEVLAVDVKNRTMTLRFQDGSNGTFPVRADLDLSRHKAGERVVFRVIEVTAIRFEKST